MAQGPGNLEKVPEEILALFPGDSRSFFSRKTSKIPELIYYVFRLKEGIKMHLDRFKDQKFSNPGKGDTHFPGPYV